MNYEEFKNELQEEIQTNFLQHIDFMSHIVNKTNETLDALTMHFDGQDVACTIYPEGMYEEHKKGVPVWCIADNISESISANIYPKMPEITTENAKKSISFSLVNSERNKAMLKDCPYKKIHDLAAVPRWHISDDASFLVTGKVMEALRMTKEEILNIAQRNTESAEYTCRGMDDVMKEVLASEGMGDELIAELFPMQKLPFYIITNQNNFDGSCAILSDSFMQRTAEQVGNDEIYLLPASRHEMIAVNPAVITDTSELKDLVMSVNGNPEVLKTEDFLSDSVYKYNANTHSLSVCDNKGLFHDKTVGKDTVKPAVSKGRSRV